jgi:hypothetical protein
MPAPTAPLVTTTTWPDLAQGGNLRHELLQLRGVRLFPAVSQHAGAEFHDHPPKRI